MKKVFTLVALTLVAAVSISVSAQSSKIVGKWNSSTVSQMAMFEEMGADADIEKTVTTMTFNNDGTYVIYTYTKANINLKGLVMYMFLESNDRGTWKYNNDSISFVSKGIEIINLDISFNDPMIDAIAEDVKASLREACNQIIGVEIVYEISSLTDNKIEISFSNEYMPMEYTLTRIE